MSTSSDRVTVVVVQRTGGSVHSYMWGFPAEEMDLRVSQIRGLYGPPGAEALVGPDEVAELDGLAVWQRTVAMDLSDTD